MTTISSFARSPTPFLPSLSASCHSVIDKTIKNSFFLAATGAGLGAITSIVSAVLLPPVTALIITAAAFMTFKAALFFQPKERRKWMFSERSLLFSTLCSFVPSISERPWSTRITKEITLSACPMKVDGKIQRHNRPDAVLSMLEPFETQPHLLSDPVTPREWKRAGVKFLNLPTPDVTPVKREDIKRGAKFIDRQVSKGRSITVHCLAGVGRSATVLICYLIKYRGMKPKAAVEFVRSKRRIAVHENSPALRQWV
jgi:predicted protein tyrosine phosphatase